MELVNPDKYSHLFYRGESADPRPKTAWDDLGAMFSIHNEIGATALHTQYNQGQDMSIWTLPEDEETMLSGYSPAEWLSSTGMDVEQQTRMLPVIGNTTSPAEARQAMAKIRKTHQYLEQISNMGLSRQLWTGALAGILSPVTLASMAILPVGATATAARTGVKIGGIAMAETAAQEAYLHQLQPERTIGESLLNTIAGGAVAGALGYGITGTVRSLSGRKASNESMSIKDELEANLAVDLRAADYVPEVDEALPYHQNYGLPDEVESLSIDEIRALAKQEGIEEAELIAQRQRMYDEADAETSAFAERFLVFRGVNAATNLQQSPLASMRSAFTKLSGGGLAQKANVQGQVGSKIPAPVENRILVGGRFAEQQHNILDSFRKDFYGSAAKAQIKDFTTGAHEKNAALIMRGDGQTVADNSAQGFRELLPWEKTMYQKLKTNQEQKFDYLFRRGYFDDVIKRAEMDEDSLVKNKKDMLKQYDKDIAAEKSIKTKALLEQERDLRAAQFDELYSISKQHTGRKSRASTKRLVDILTGDKNYMPQSWNQAKVIEMGEDYFVKSAVNATKSKLRRLSMDESLPDSVRAMHKFRLDNWNPAQEAFGAAKAFKTISEGSDSDLGGIDGGLLNPNGAAKIPNSTKSREIMIEQDDYAISQLLDDSYMGIQLKNDFQVLPYMELKEAGFLPGSSGMAKLMKEINDEFDVRTHGMDGVEKGKMKKRVERDLEDFQATIDSLMNQANKSSPMAKKVSAAMRNWSVMTGLGSVAITSLPDATMAAMKMGGLKAFGRNIKPVLKQNFSDGFRNIDIEDASTAASLYEVGAATTMHKIGDNADDGMVQGKIGAAWAMMTEKMMKATGLPHLNQINKQMIVRGTQDRLIRIAMGDMEIDKADKLWLAQHGWSAAKLKKIKGLYSRNGYDHGNAKVFDFGAAREKYEADLLKYEEALAKTESSGVPPKMPRSASDMDMLDEFATFANWISTKYVVTPTAPDIPKFIKRSALMQAIAQFKSFGFSSVDKTLNPAIQQMAYGNFRMVEGILSTWAMAAGAWYIYMASRNRLDEVDAMSPQQIAYNSLMRSGMLPLLDMALPMVQKATANFFGAGDVVGLAPVSKYYSRGWTTELLGPSWGKVTAVSNTVSNLAQKTADGEGLDHRDYSRMARLFPFNNIFYIRAALEHTLD